MCLYHILILLIPNFSAALTMERQPTRFMLFDLFTFRSFICQLCRLQKHCNDETCFCTFAAVIEQMSICRHPYEISFTALTDPK